MAWWWKSHAVPCVIGTYVRPSLLRVHCPLFSQRSANRIRVRVSSAWRRVIFVLHQSSTAYHYHPSLQCWLLLLLLLVPLLLPPSCLLFVLSSCDRRRLWPFVFTKASRCVGALFICISHVCVCCRVWVVIILVLFIIHSSFIITCYYWLVFRWSSDGRTGRLLWFGRSARS